MARISRLEITKAVKLEVFKRAGGPGDVHCEGCGLRLGLKPFNYDHQFPEWLRTAPKAERVITAADVKLLGVACCHAPKTAREAGQRAKGNRLTEKAAKAKAPSRPLPGSRSSPWKAKIGGGWVRRDAE